MADQSKELLEQRINKLKNERQQFKKSIVTLLHSVPVAISLKRMQDSTFVFCNKAFSDLFQFNADEIIGRKEADLFPTIDYVDTVSRSVSGDKKLQTFRGYTRVVQSFRMPMKKGGSAKYLFTFYIDKTNDVKALDQFEAFEKMMLKAERVAHIGHWEYDVIENEARISPECARIFGTDWSSTPHEWNDFTARIHPDDKNRIVHAFTNALRKGAVFESTYRIQTPDNITKHVQARGYFEKNAQGKIQRSIGMISDITPLKRREQKLERYTAQLENAQTIAKLGHWLHDVTNNRFLISPGVKKLLHLESSEFTLKSLLWIIHPTDRSTLVKSLREKDDREIEVEIRIVIQNETKWLRLIGRNLFTDKGSLIQAFGTVQEITKQKTKELVLEARENYFHRLFAHSFYAMLVLTAKPQQENREFICRDINTAFTEYFGIDKNNAIDQPLSALFPNVFHKWLPHLNSVLAEQKSKHFEMYWPASQKYFQIIAYSTESDQLAVIFNDITLRKYHEEELRINELRFRLLFENSADIMWMLNMDLEPIIISPSAERVRGFNIETIYKQSFEEKMTPASYKRLQDKGQPYFEQIKALKKNAPQQTLEIELDFYHQDGGIIPSQVRVSPVYSDMAEPIALIGVTRDITKRRQAEQESKINAARLHESQRLANLGSWDYNSRKKRVTVSEEMSTMAEYNVEDISDVYDLLKFYRKLVHPDDLKTTLKLIRTSLEQRQDWDIHYRLATKTNNIRQIREISKLEQDNQGRIRHIHATIQDVTDVKNDKENIRKKENPLQSLLTALPDYILVLNRNGVIVDVNVPGRHSFEKQSQRVSELFPEHAAKILTKHISKVLRNQEKQSFEVSFPVREKRQNFEVHFSPCGHNEVLAILRRTNADSRVSTGGDENELLKKILNSKKERIALVGLNGQVLFANTAYSEHLGYSKKEFSNKNEMEWVHPDDKREVKRAFSKTVELGATVFQYRIQHKNGTWRIMDAKAVLVRKEQPQGIVVVSRDISAEHASSNGKSHLDQTQPKLNDEFNNVLKTNNGHSDILLNSYDRETQNSTFHGHVEKEQNHVPPTPDEAIPGGNETILLTDDERHICEVSKTFLEQAGYKVYVANTGEDAIDLFFHHMHEIQLLVLDVVMPGKSGKQVYDEVSTFKPDIPVLFCSAYTRHLLREDHDIYISRQLLRKPYDREELLLKVRDVLDQEQYQEN